MRFDGIETSTPPKLGSRSVDAPRALPHLPGQGGEQAAQKLRARGFSYRRIAEELRVRYDMVSQWLSGLPPTARTAATAAPLPPRAVPAEPQHEAARTQAAASADAARIAVLEQRLSEVFVALQRLSEEARQREGRLLAALAEERRVAAAQIERLNADITGLRTAVAVLSLRPPGTTSAATPRAADVARPPSTQGFWQRREH